MTIITVIFSDFVAISMVIFSTKGVMNEQLEEEPIA